MPQVNVKYNTNKYIHDKLNHKSEKERRCAGWLFLEITCFRRKVNAILCAKNSPSFVWRIKEHSQLKSKKLIEYILIRNKDANRIQFFFDFGIPIWNDDWHALFSISKNVPPEATNYISFSMIIKKHLSGDYQQALRLLVLGDRYSTAAVLPKEIRDPWEL